MKTTIVLLTCTAALLAVAPATAHPPNAPPGHTTTFQSMTGANTCYIYGYTDVSAGLAAQPQLEYYKETSNSHPLDSSAENVPVYDAVEYAWETLQEDGDPPLAPDSTSGLQRSYDYRYTGATAAADWLSDCMLEQ